ncbi:GNAT family N-acetyltransferase [Vibrio coralliilyticus]|uniref:GNAT family N-acetyltransferase n=1 Tax=Vibrio coralliilyticus TaxID=190893 RepID=UPI00148E2149|nr:GNAT family N-acetyltransferase [Vibrio coralliilyticus]NOI28495.1 GNAT family N-acetyltransferase [Vibrio coralliilyticus]NOI50679.1 GNAT family N-acetyltransferase [Vibrio coralliilyticus]
MENLETDRLKLRLPTEGDAAFIQSLYNTEGFLRFVGDKHIRSRDDAVEYIRNNMLAMREAKSVCLLVVENKSDSQQLGVCGLIKRDELDAYDIGYGFMPNSLGQGYGLEAGKAVVEYARQCCDIDELMAITSSDNEASKSLLNRLGFTYVKVQNQISDKIDLLLYQLSFAD